MFSSHIVLRIIAITIVGFFILRQFQKSHSNSINPSNLEPGPIRHASLSPELDERIRRFEPVFSEVYPCSHKEWLDGFQRDLNPESEIVVWETMANAYQSFTAKHTLTLDAKKEAFGLLLVRSAADEKTTLSETKLRYLSSEEAKELVGLYSTTPKPILILEK